MICRFSTKPNEGTATTATMTGGEEKTKNHFEKAANKYGNNTATTEILEADTSV